MKVISILIGLLLVCGVAYGDSTARALYMTPYDGLTDWLNTNPSIAHTHDYNVEWDKYQPKTQLGVGVDAVILEVDTPRLRNGYLQEITIENRYDFNNKVYAGYAVAKVNLAKAGSDLMRSIFR